MNNVDTDECDATAAPARWLVLIHQLPAKPAYARIKVWRRLQGIGAVAVKPAVFTLPACDATQEDFAWLLREIEAAGGEALLCEARLISGLSDEAVRDLFNAARAADYRQLADEIGRLVEPPGPGVAPGPDPAHLRRLRTRAAQIAGIDFFGADGGEAVAALLRQLETTSMSDDDHKGRQDRDLRGRTWVTRQGVHIDRIASAWLIRRFIDAAARFKFVLPRGYRPLPGELRFDMFEAEYTHEGDRCTFEVLLARTGQDDPALSAIAEIVHDIDLKDARFGRSETAGVAQFIAGIVATTADDEQRLLRGGAVLDALYAAFGGRRAGDGIRR